MNDLHQQFLQLSREKNKIQYQLLNLLPEIFRTELYKKYTKTIEGYAWRFAQIPKSVVQKTLKLEKHLEGKPCLKEAVAKVGINKVAMIATLVQPETDEMFADKVQYMSKEAIQQLSKELRGKPVATTITIQLDPEMTTLFLKLKKKYEGNNQEVMKQILVEVSSHKNAKGGVATENKNPQFASSSSQKQHFHKKSPGKTTKALAAASRYIQKHIREEALTKSNGLCSYLGCNRPHDAFHHPERFATIKTQPNQNPHTNIKPLCKTHHEFMHNGLVQNETLTPEQWKLKFTTVTNPVDLLYRKYRR